MFAVEKTTDLFNKLNFKKQIDPRTLDKATLIRLICKKKYFAVTPTQTYT